MRRAIITPYPSGPVLWGGRIGKEALALRDNSPGPFFALQSRQSCRFTEATRAPEI
jgi:hypothetical protein